MDKGVTSGVSMGAFYLAPILFRHHRMSEGQAFVFFSLLSANALLGNVSTQVLRVIFSISILAPSSIGILFFFPLFSSLFFWLGALSGPFLWPPLPCKTKYKKTYWPSLQQPTDILPLSQLLTSVSAKKVSIFECGIGSALFFLLFSFFLFSCVGRAELRQLAVAVSFWRREGVAEFATGAVPRLHFGFFKKRRGGGSINIQHREE